MVGGVAVPFLPPHLNTTKDKKVIEAVFLVNAYLAYRTNLFLNQGGKKTWVDKCEDV